MLVGEEVKCTSWWRRSSRYSRQKKHLTRELWASRDASGWLETPTLRGAHFSAQLNARYLACRGLAAYTRGTIHHCCCWKLPSSTMCCRHLHRGAPPMPTAYRGCQRHYTILGIIKRDKHGTPRVGRRRDSSKGRNPCTRQYP